MQNFDHSTVLLQTELKKSKLSTFVKINEALLGKKLDALRAEPIQRIPRYLLLLNKLDSDADSIALKNCLETITDIVVDLELNLEISKGREHLKLLEQHVLGGKFPLDNGNRFCVRQGMVFVEHLTHGSTSQGKQQYLMLMFNDIMLMCSENLSEKKLLGSGEFKSTFRPKKYYWLKALVLKKDCLDDSVSFEIQCTESNRVERICCVTLGEKAEWMEDIEKYVHINRRQMSRSPRSKTSANAFKL